MDKLPTILIVEDYSHHATLIGNILKHEGYTILEATNIDDALQRIQEFQEEVGNAEEAEKHARRVQSPLIAIIDIGIPQSRDGLVLKRGGVTLLEKFQKDYQEISSIFLTVYGEDDDVRKIAKQYNVPIVPKPLSSKQLVREIKKIFPR